MNTPEGYNSTTPTSSTTCTLTEKIPDGPSLVYWEEELVAKGKALCESYSKTNDLPPAPTSTEDPDFIKALQERGRFIIEERYSMPPDYVAFPRKFYDPNGSIDSPANEHIATLLVGISTNPLAQKDVVKLIQGLTKHECQGRIMSVLNNMFNEVIRSRQIPKSEAKTGTVANFKELVHEFYVNPVLSLLKVIFEIFWELPEKDNVFLGKAQYDVMKRAGMWYQAAETCELSKKKKTGGKPCDKPCADFITSEAKSTINSSFRKKFTKSNPYNPHGCTLAKSQSKLRNREETLAARSSHPRATKGLKFNFEKHVSNWLGPKHLQFLENNRANQNPEVNIVNVFAQQV
jgi:hypothetical protein